METNTYYNIDRVNFSSLKWFKESPLYYFKMKNKEIEDEKKRWQDLGTQFHMFLLQPDEFNKHFVYLEFETPQSPKQKLFCEEYVKTNNAIDSYKSIYSTDKKSEKKIEKEALELVEQLADYIDYLKKSITYKAVISKSTFDFLNKAKEAVLNHKVASKLLITPDEDLLSTSKISNNEFPIYWDINKLNLQCKSLLDRLIIDHESKSITLVDLKSTNSLKDFNTKIKDYNYHQQLAFYWLAVYWYFKNVLGKDNIEEYSHRTFIVAVTTNEVVECRVFELHDNVIFGAINEVNELLEKLSYHVNNNVWDYPENYYENDGIEHIHV